MPMSAGLRPAVAICGLFFLTLFPAVAAAQAPERFATGVAEQAWVHWQTAARAILDRDSDAAEGAFRQLVDMDVSALRIAMMADYSVMNTSLGGAVLLIEQDHQAGELGEAGEEVYSRLEKGREQLNEADDAFYFATIGRFDVANANLKALLASEPDPVALLEFVDRVPRRREILVQLLDHPVIGPAARQMLQLLARGEERIKADPTRIKQNIQRLSGPPRAVENAVVALKQSGEYAIPFLLQALMDPEQRDLVDPILRVLPQIGRPALNPLVQSLQMNDQTTKRYVVDTLGRLGYAQSVPYLLNLRDEAGTLPEVISAVEQALDAIAEQTPGMQIGMTPAEAFFALAEAYYADANTLRADPRLDQANVWYWQDGLLVNVPVPTPIFNEIMTMRTSWQSLRLRPDSADAEAIWIAANFRRVAQLPDGASDPTIPEGFPAGAYFARSVGPEVDTLALARAVKDGDPAVALGVIDALRSTAGPASIMTTVEGRLPLAEALSFSDRLVRIHAGLALANAAPTEAFPNYQNLMPVLSEALLLFSGARNALVVDPDDNSANRIAGQLRDNGYEVLTAGSLFTGLNRVRTELPGIDVIVLASDIQQPDLAEALRQLRGEFQFASTPVVLVAKGGQQQIVNDLTQSDMKVTSIADDAGAVELIANIRQVSKAVGSTEIDADLGLILALDAADALRSLATTHNPLFDVASVENALTTALRASDADLRRRVATVLGFVPKASAQEAIAAVALNDQEPKDMRIAMFAAVAHAAKQHGNLLGAKTVDAILELAQSEGDLDLRTAASQTIGALNLAGNPGSKIIREQYNG